VSLRRRLASDRGQTSSEYVGMLLLVGTIIAALVMTGLPGRIAQETSDIVCRIAGGACDAPDSDEPNADTCVLTQSSRSAEGSVKITFIRLEGGVKGVREERADGSVKITLEANAGAGLEFATPGAGVEGGGTNVGTGEREVTVTAGGKVSRSWVFDAGDARASNEAADQFTEDVEKRVSEQLDLWPWTHGPDLPDHQETSVSGGVTVTATGELGNGTGLEGNLGAALGAKFDEKTGERTIFFEVKGGGKAGASAGFFDGFSAAGQGTVTVGVTYTRDGREKSMEVLGQADGSIEASFDPTGGALDQTMSDLSDNLSASVGGRVVLDAKLDLTDPANLAAAQTFITGIDPATGQPVGIGDASRDLYERFRDDGKVSVQTFATANQAYGGEFDGTVVGGEFKYAEEDANLIKAWYLDGAEGFKPWDTCRPA